ncbi:MAG: adenylate/guanylate cyclase domain-containing protein [Cyanobacteria bacterium P01_C01_bin.89]
MTSSSSNKSQDSSQQVIEATVVEASEVNPSATQTIAVEVAVDATVVDAEGKDDLGISQDPPGSIASHESPSASSDTGSALVTSKGSFKSFLAPLKRDTFKQVVSDVEAKLGVVNQTLSMLDVLNDNQGGFESVLEEMLESISLKTGELLNADRTTIYLLDEEKDELWSKVAKGMPELRFPASVGIAGEVAQFRKVVNIPYDFYEDPRSAAAKKFDQKSGYRTYTMLALPLLNEDDGLVAVVQLINKLKPDAGNSPQASLSDRIDLKGFTEDDEQVFREFAPSIRLILESSRAFYAAMQRQRAANALMKATEALSKGSLDLQETLKNVMDQAKALMQADRSTLWLLDDIKDELWTRLPIGGEMREIRIPSMGNSFAAQVAQSGKPLLIPFDLYSHPDSDTSKETDQRTGYRTCSMLCMPVFNSDRQLIGVTQLINKTRQGEHPEYDPENWPEAPERWKASFNQGDQQFMETFNIQAGVALQNAKLFAEVKQQEQMQKDILRSLSDGVISVDRNGSVIAANESAKEFLGLPQSFILEGRPIEEVIRIKVKEEGTEASNKFGQWMQTALGEGDDDNRQQYYPDQILLPSPDAPKQEADLWDEDADDEESTEERSVNLSLNTIADAQDGAQVRGALVVMEDISDEKRLKSTMYRYMTQELAEQLLASGETKMGGDRKDVSVLFSDIRSYTTLTESMQAEEVVAMLNEYFESMVDAVFKHKGTLDKYIGDAIMAVFGSPLPLEDHAWMSVQTAIDMRHRLVEFNAARRTMGKQEIAIGIGLHSDEVISGNIGSSRRMEFTAIGDGVNLGSRLEGATKQYGCDIMISENTYHKCGADRVVVRELDYIKVKGKTKPVSVYELVGIAEGDLARPISDDKKQVIEAYSKGRQHYLDRKFAQAMAAFGSVLEINSGDKAAALQLGRCQHYLTHPPEDDWDGAFTMTSK